MKRISTLIIIASVIFAVSCGGYTAPPTGTVTTPQTRPSGITGRRIFVANTTSNVINIIDADKDLISGYGINGAAGASILISGGANTIGAFDRNTTQMVLLDSNAENISNNLATPANFEDMVLTSDGKSAYFTMSITDQVYFYNISDNTKNTTINNMSGARRLNVNHAGTKVLVFRDNVNAVTIINTADNTTLTVSDPTSALDHPYRAYFTTDDSKAYILSCGAECGGTQAKVSVVDMTLATPAITNTSNVPAATVAAMDSTNLYVVGTAAGVGKISIVTLSSLAVNTPAVSLSDGLHTSIALASNSKIYIGATGCTLQGATGAAGSKGCLSVYSISGSSAAVLLNRGFVTGLTPISNRTVVYVAEGNLLNIYDTGTDTLQAKQINVIGFVKDARQIDQ